MKNTSFLLIACSVMLLTAFSKGSAQQLPAIVYETTPTDIDNRSLDHSKPVGTLDGTYQVLPNGAASYTVPIYIPKGTAGMQPSISLTYSSRAGNGQLGWGWNISGLSAITRDSENYYLDKNTEESSFPAIGKLALDGNRLVYNSQDDVYETRIGNGTRISLYASAIGTDQSYKAETIDGKTILYGYSADSRVCPQPGSYCTSVHSWLIGRVTDKNGNYCTYHYENLDGEFYIKEIKYTGNEAENTDPYNSIIFNYGLRSDVNFMFSKGQEVKQAVLLKNITVKSEGQTVREYDLTYTLDKLSLLHRITESNGIGESYNPTIFQYGDSHHHNQISSELYSPNPDVEDGHSIYGDYDGDGLMDRLVVNTGSRNWTFYKSGYTVRHSSAIQGLAVSNFTSMQPDIIPGWCAAGDFNGDGNDDIIVANKKFHLTRFELWESDGTDFTYKTQLQFSNIDVEGVIAAPFLGNGLDQLLIRIEDGGTRTLSLYSLYDEATETIGNSFFVVDDNYSVHQGRMATMNTDNDSKPDLFIVDNNKLYIHEYERLSDNNYDVNETEFTNILDEDWPLKLGDFNGDGLTDLLYYKKNSGNEWKIRYGKKGSFTAEYAPPVFTNPNTDPEDNYYTENFFTGDFNGDGKTDIAEYYSNPTTPGQYDYHYDVFYSIGNNVFDKETNVSTDNKYKNARTNVTVGDFTGDGTDDLHVYWGSAGTGQPYIIAFHPEEEPFHISTILNGLNSAVDIEYEAMVCVKAFGLSQYVKGSGAQFPLNDVVGTSFVVTADENYNLETYDPMSSSNERRNVYFYEGAKVHRQGLGFLGMEKFSMAGHGYRQTQSYDLDNSHFYPVVTGSLRQKATQTVYLDLAETLQENLFINHGNGRFSPAVYTTTEHNLVTNTSTYTTNAYYSNGNLSNRLVQYGSQTTPVKTEQATFFYTTANCWRPNVVLTKFTNSTHKDDSGNPYGRSEDYTYDAVGNVTSVTYDDGDPMELKVTYTYDGFGNSISMTQSAPQDVNLSDQISYTNYDSKGRFQESSVNNLGITTEYTYDRGLGAVLTTKSLGNETRQEYDKWGKLTKTFTPNGEVLEITKNWTPLPNPISSIYSRKNTSNSSPDVTTFFNERGESVRSQTTLFGNKLALVDKVYNNDATLMKESQPYFSGDFVKWVEYTYDDAGRVSTQTFVSSSNPAENLQTKFTYANLTTTMEDPDGNKVHTTLNAAGQTEKVEDNGGTVTYKYHSNGQLKKQSNGPEHTEFEYDMHGNRTKMIDPNAGTIEYEYNAFGQLTYQKMADGSEHFLEYDEFGRKVKKTTPEGEFKYAYYSDGNGKYLINTETGPNSSYVKKYHYDSQKRVTQVDETITKDVFSTRMQYDGRGNLAYLTYPSGFLVTNKYDEDGTLLEVHGSEDVGLIWKLDDVIESNVPRQFSYGNGITTTRSKDQYGYLNSILAEHGSGNTKQHLTYNFDPKRNVMLSRTDVVRAQHETFQYDNLYRLTAYTVSGAPTRTVNYQANGNITNKSDVGDYIYNNAAHTQAVSRIDNPVGECKPCLTQDVTFDSRNNVTGINEGGFEYSILYNDAQTRKKSVLKDYGTFRQTSIYYVGSYEKVIDGSGNTKEIHYVTAGQERVAAYVKESNGGTQTKEVYYIHKDLLGSFQMITRDDASVLAEFNYGPWGKLRDAGNWATYLDSEAERTQLSLLGRGFTGHEHIATFGLINMNGRMYDPCLGRFLQVDNFVQSEGATQGLNRYSYVVNNPLIYSDPSGEVIVPILTAAAIGALQSAVTYSFTAGSDWSWSGLGSASLRGAVTGAISGGIGAIAGNAANSFAYSMMENLTASTITSTMYGEQLTLGSIAGMFTGALMGSSIKGGKYGDNQWLNGLKDLAFSATKGYATGFTSGLTRTVIEGRNVMQQSIMGGVMGGASNAIAVTIAFGLPVNVTEGDIMENGITTTDPEQRYLAFTLVHKIMSSQRLTFREGGILALVSPGTALVFGSNVAMGAATRSPDYNPVYYRAVLHELFHMHQITELGWGDFYFRAIPEQWNMDESHDMPGHLEFDADVFRDCARDEGKN